MRKLIGIIVIILITFLCGCGFQPVNTEVPLIVKEIQQIKYPYCRYYGTYVSFEALGNNWCIRDTCGKWNIGDTIKLCK